MNDKRAKIIATVGPACDQPFMLRALIEDGVDTFRLNFSHGEHARHSAVIAAIRNIENETGKPIGILQDLQGPKIRLGQMPGGWRSLDLRENVDIVLGGKSTDDSLPLPHPEVFAAARLGHRLLIDDGRIALEIVDIAADRLKTIVTQGGRVSDRKGVNLPDCLLDLPVLTEKDRADLAFGLEHGVDWVALSFVQTAKDLDEIRTLIAGRAGLIAKIEKPSALADIATIVEKADAIMIARGDLGVETPPEQVPGHQKEIISRCRACARPVIVATQMLESMTGAPTPTRAEASDVATAIYDGADAVMLSAETATGQFPRETVTIMRRIIAATERHALYDQSISATRLPAASTADKIADTGAQLATEIGASCLVAFSLTGATGMRAAARRPKLPLLVLTRQKAIARRMSLVWGVRAALESDGAPAEEMARSTSRAICSLRGRDQIVMLSGASGQTGSTNNIRILEIA